MAACAPPRGADSGPGAPGDSGAATDTGVLGAAAAWAEATAGIGAEARALAADGTGGFRAATGDLAARFGAEGMVAARSEARVAVAVAAWGRGGSGRPVGPAAPVLGACASVPAADGACVRSVERPIGGGAEWWARSTAGLHHGFRVDTRLPGAGPLWLDIAFDGASDLELTSGGDGVSFVDAGGEPWSWAGLRAWDDRGLPVAATLELRAGGVRVHLDDADARYPLHVDPLLTTAWATRTGGAVSNFFGAALSGVGDLNGDGYGDLAVGAPGFSADTGRVFVFYGAATGIAATPDLTITGSNTGIRLGEAVAAAGDVNDDGYADLLVGAPEFSGARGRAYVHYGGPSGISATPDVTLTGSTTSIRLGASLAGPGDVNGDGVDDIVVAAPQLTSSRGGLYLHLGSASGLNTTSASLTQGLVSNSELGAALAGAGDVNGDGFADIVAGAPVWNSARGAVYVFHGGATGFGASPATAITSTTAGERWGTAVAGGGDVDGDGFPEIVAGAPFASSNAGRVALYPGGPTGVSTTAAWTLAGAAATETGRALVFIGDVGGDGRDDLAVGAPRTGSYTGAVFVFEGSATGLDTTATASLAGTAVGQQFGGGLGAGGDIDGDGYAELLVGAPGASTNTGQARVYRGAGDRDRDGILSDLDCDDDDAAVGLAPTWYRDGDGDGEGDPADTVDACTAPAGYAAVPLGPCDDGDPGTADAGGAAWRDGDGDGFGDAGARTWACRFTTPAGVVTVELAGWVADDTDCDDTDTAIRPGASEAVGDGVDQDCDGGDACFADGDGDGVRTGAVVASADLDCADAGEAAPAAPAGDCDDADPATYPGAPELPGDGKDQSCDGSEDCYSNADGDGFRTGALVVSADADCADAGEALATLPSGDCDDADAATYPGAPELPGDGKDQSCDGSEDCYSNADGDGFRTGALVVSADSDCTDPGEALATLPSGDCDDADLATYPGAPELPGDGKDQSCDGSEDCYSNADGDGFRTGALVVSADADCTDAGEALTTLPSGDCDDADAATYPGAPELPGDGKDQSCDGSEDCYSNADGDGFRTGALVVSADADCTDAGEALASLPAADCDDADAATYPGAPELPGDGKDQSCDGSEDCYSNADGDGFRTGALVVSADADCADTGEALTTLPSGDCDDADAATYPGAPELPGDGKDQSCDGSEDCYSNADGDGFRTGALVVSADADCADAGEALAARPSGDCDDADAATHPGAPELPGDGKDQSCDGSEDCYSNADGDGFRTGALVASADADCTDAGEALATLPAADCDDTDPATFPGAPELPGDHTDQSCDGAELCFVDADADGWRLDDAVTVLSPDTDCFGPGEAAASTPTLDCDDADAEIHPAAAERPGDAVDQDCDGTEACYVDDDGDGHRPNATATLLSADIDCGGPGEATAAAPLGDCDDTDPTISPVAAERAGDAVDQDCDGAELCFVDADGDGHRPDATSTLLSADIDCGGPGEASAAAPLGDCDDADPAISPVATEIPGDAVDQDCDGAEVCFADADGDGHRPGPTATVASADVDCSDAGEALATAPTTDCDDTDPAVSPLAAERPGDGVDQDCDAAESCYVDADGDGHRRPDLATVRATDLSCTSAGLAPASAPAADCDDADPATHPGAFERPGDGVDQSCDGAETCYVDGDGDGVRPDATATVSSADAACTGPGEAADTAPVNDCDDGDAAIFPGATERPGDGVDQDCDATELCYADADADGFRTGLTRAGGRLACDGPGEASAARPDGDCDDADPAAFPGAPELPGDEVDQSCDGAETCFADADGDGVRPDPTATVFSADAACDGPGEANAAAPVGDCADDDPTIFPGAVEAPGDEVDQDCDRAEICFVDADADGFRPDATTTVASADLRCTGPGEARALTPAGDCADDDPTRFPLAADAPGDEIDQNCDGTEICFVDADGDGVRPDAESLRLSLDADCADPGEAPASAPFGDCADADPAAFPGAAEAPGDGIDQDCDGAELCFVDADGDGAPAPDATPQPGPLDCAAPGLRPAGQAPDCDDADPTVFPGAPEAPRDGIDQDCDGRDLVPEKPSLRLTCAAAAPAPAAGLALLALGLATLRRRRR